MIGGRACIGFHAGNPDRGQPYGDSGAGKQTKNTTAGDFHGSKGPEWQVHCTDLGFRAPPCNLPQNWLFRSFLDFRGYGGFNRRTSRKEFLFDPPTGAGRRRLTPDSAVRPRAQMCLVISAPQELNNRVRRSDVRQSVGKAWRHSRSADAARCAVGSRCRCRHARSAPRAARGRRRARGRAHVYRQGSRTGHRRHRRQVGDSRPDGREDRPRPARGQRSAPMASRSISMRPRRSRS